MIRILLSCNKFTIIDNDDFDFLNKMKWSYDGKYAVCTQNLKKKYLHRILLNCPEKRTVDHINGNPLDNRKSNLRICLQSQNSRNSKLPKNNSSGFKGVSWIKANKKWEAYIHFNYKKISLGCFYDRRSAALEYNKAAIKYFGEFAKLNELRGVLL